MREIASKLHISVRTVESHKYDMMEKLGLKSTAEVIQFAIKGLMTGFRELAVAQRIKCLAAEKPALSVCFVGKTFVQLPEPERVQALSLIRQRRHLQSPQHSMSLAKISGPL